MNRHSSAGTDEANHPHHSLHEQMGQLVDRERVLIGENDQLRAQLVERKEQEKKKFADLMVQYRQLRDNANIKQEYEDDHEGTSNNQVTVKTEWNDEVVKVEIKEEDEEDDDIFIKHEYVPAYIKTESNGYEVKVEIKEKYEEDLDNEGTSNNQVMVKTEWNDDEVKVEEVKEEIKEEYEDDDEDSSTNAHNVTELNIKTESMECDLVEVKDEIKEEDEHEHDEDCDGCDRCVVKKELVSDDDGDETEDNQTGGESRSVNVQMEDEFDEVNIRGGDLNQVDAERYEAIQPNVDCDQLVNNPSRDSLNASNEDSFNEGGPILGSEQLLNTLNEPTERTVTQSGDVLSPWTSTGQNSSRTALNQQATGSTQHNKRKQAQLKRTDKRSKKSLQDDGEDEIDGEDIANDDREEAKVKVPYLNCTESECNVKLDSMEDLHEHLDTVHRLSPLKCFAMDCNSRFDHPIQIGDHLKLHHPQGTRFLCARCPKEFYSQTKTYQHWYYQHLTGHFQCNFVRDCTEVTDTRCKMRTHQLTKHHNPSKLFHCTHPGCTASFAFNALLKRHESTHLNSQPFHCIWPQCNIRTNRRSSLVTHIRTKHFGLPRSVKEQMAKNIVDLRDPNEYVRVVAE